MSALSKEDDVFFLTIQTLFLEGKLKERDRQDVEFGIRIHFLPLLRESGCKSKCFYLK